MSYSPHSVSHIAISLRMKVKAHIAVVLALTSVHVVAGTLNVLPWEAPQHEKLPWQGLENDLPELLKVQAANNSIALMLFNDMFTELALNTITSLVLYGKAPNYIVAVTNEAGVSACKQLRLPCYNATGLVDNSVNDTRSGGHLKHFSPAWNAVVWGKTIVAAEVFKLGYDLLFTDADVVYIKDAFRAYSTLLDSYDADGSFMCEVKHRPSGWGLLRKEIIMNSGNFLLRNNVRTRALMDAWLGGARLGYDGNQRYLNLLASPGFTQGNQTVAMCNSRQECSAAKARGMAAIKCHPVHTEPGTGRLRKWDQLAAMRPQLCSDRRAYLHAFGRNVSNSLDHKKEWFQQLGVWMTDVRPDQVVTVRPTAVLPCPTEDAWVLDYPEVLPQETGRVLHKRMGQHRPIIAGVNAAVVHNIT